MSIMAAVILLAAGGATAEEAVRAARAMTSVSRSRCDAGTGHEIVVCGASPGVASPYRLPLPDQRGSDGGRAPIDEYSRPPTIGRLQIGPPVNFGRT